MMRHFYKALIAGRPRAEALRVAQASVADDLGHPEWKHPFYWAAFLLSGAWTPIPGGLSERAVEAAARRSTDAPPASAGVQEDDQ